MSEGQFARGQVWSYKTRPEEEGSRIHIARVDHLPKSPAIYHLYVDGLSIRNPAAASGIQDHLPHSPVSEETLRLSVVELVDPSEAAVPDISEGYGVWREAFDRGEAGYFTIPVAQIIDHIESVVRDLPTDG